MANPEKLTVTEFEANAINAMPADVAGNSIDTNGSVPIKQADFGGAGGRLLIHVINAATRTLTVTVEHGDNPPAVRAGVGDLQNAVAIATSAAVFIGPLETARFQDSDGDINVTFTGTGGAAVCRARVYLLPKAV